LLNSLLQASKHLFVLSIEYNLFFIASIVEQHKLHISSLQVFLAWLSSFNLFSQYSYTPVRGFSEFIQTDLYSSLPMSGTVDLLQIFLQRYTLFWCALFIDLEQQVPQKSFYIIKNFKLLDIFFVHLLLGKLFYSNFV